MTKPACHPYHYKAKEVMTLFKRSYRGHCSTGVVVDQLAHGWRILDDWLSVIIKLIVYRRVCIIPTWMPRDIRIFPRYLQSWMVDKLYHLHAMFVCKRESRLLPCESSTAFQWHFLCQEDNAEIISIIQIIHIIGKKFCPGFAVRWVVDMVGFLS